MEEQLISLETARLAKEKKFDKGFSILCLDSDFGEGGYVTVEQIGKVPDEDYDSALLFCTQSLLQKWLREKHNINVLVSFDTIDDSETSYVWNIVEYIDEGTGRKKDTWDFYKRTDSFSKQMMWWNTYEEALEFGLQAALKTIN